jgi:hypothetical protein
VSEGRAWSSEDIQRCSFKVVFAVRTLRIRVKSQAIVKKYDEQRGGETTGFYAATLICRAASAP